MCVCRVCGGGRCVEVIRYVGCCLLKTANKVGSLSLVVQPGRMRLRLACAMLLIAHLIPQPNWGC